MDGSYVSYVYLFQRRRGIKYAFRKAYLMLLRLTNSDQNDWGPFVPNEFLVVTPGICSVDCHPYLGDNSLTPFGRYLRYPFGRYDGSGGGIDPERALARGDGTFTRLRTPCLRRSLVAAVR